MQNICCSLLHGHKGMLFSKERTFSRKSEEGSVII